MVPYTKKLQILFANISVKLMTAQFESQGIRLIATIKTYIVTVLINYRSVLSIKESRFGISLPQILGHSRTKNSNIATKTFYYLRTNISIEEFAYAVCIFLHDIIK